VDLMPTDPPLERVKKVGSKIGEWWRSLPKHAQLTEGISDEAWRLRKFIFRPLAELDPDTQKVLLKDFFEHVFDEAKKITPKQVEDGIRPYKEEFETVLENLNGRILAAFGSVFGMPENPMQGLTTWFSGLSTEKQHYTYSGEPAVLVNTCREYTEINEDTLLEIAKKLAGLNVESWGDDLVLIFHGKLDTAKNIVDTFIPNSISEPPLEPKPIDADSGQARLSIFFNGKNNERIFDVLDDVSSNGQVLENMLNSTIDQLSKGMAEKEKIVVLCRIIEKHIFGIHNQ